MDNTILKEVNQIVPGSWQIEANMSHFRVYPKESTSICEFRYVYQDINNVQGINAKITTDNNSCPIIVFE